MKKLYLLLLMLLLLFIPATNAVAVYQLDQPVSDLNGHTLREVFEDGLINGDIIYTTQGGLVNNFMPIINDEYSTYYVIVDTNINLDYNLFNFAIYDYNDVLVRYDILVKNQVNKVVATTGRIRYRLTSVNEAKEITIKTDYIDMFSLGISDLTVEQMDKYYDLYLEAVRFESENLEASQDVGGYQNIFRSIINGVKNLMTEMGNVWQFLNAPIITSDIRDFKFKIDWSWDLIGMLGQVLSSVQVLTLQVLLLVPSLVFQLFGIPVQVSILSLLFSNFIFLVLGWIIVKSFVI